MNVIDFLNDGYTAYHVASQIADHLGAHRFRELDERNAWHVSAGDRVFIRRSGSVLAIRMGTAPASEQALTIVAAHTDSPSLQLKLSSARIENGVARIPVEVYGGPILATWLDREVRVAGIVTYREDDGRISVRRVVTPSAIGIIPNLAIHLNRDVNDGASYNKQEHLAVVVPLANTAPQDGAHATHSQSDSPAGTPGSNAAARILHEIGTLCGLDPLRIESAELYAVPATPAAIIGSDERLVAAARIDNLAGSYTTLEAICRAGETDHTQVAIWFNHEEIGSMTSAGAAGSFLTSVIRRLYAVHQPGTGTLEETIARVLARSVLVSNDGAHALHPNYADKHDAGYAPLLGGGPVVKRSAVWRYVADANVAAWFTARCRSADVPVQQMQNRSDIPAGSTIGPAASAQLGIRGVDIGVPMLAMHSARETMHERDVEFMTRALVAVYEGDLHAVPDDH